MITLAIFDFDGTLFRSPGPPEGTPHKRFINSPESLMPPHVPLRPSSDYWIEVTVLKMREAQLRRGTLVALITARRDKCSDRIDELLGQKRLDPNFFHIRSADLKKDKSPVHFKRKCVLEILDFSPEIEHISIWEDDQDNIDTVKDVARRRRLSFEHHLVRRNA